MADVQKENGYTKIANQLLDELPKFKFNGTQLRIIMTVWRFTYGFNRKQSELSTSFISRSIGIDKARVKKTLKNLIEMNIILVVGEAGFSSSRILSFNKNFEQWGAKKDDRGEKEPQGSKSTPPQGSKKTPKKESIKESNKENVPFKKIIEHLNHKTGKNFRHSSKQTKEYISARWKEGYSVDDFMEVINTKAEQWAGDKKMDKYLRPSTLFLPTNFENYLNEKGNTKPKLVLSEKLQLEKRRDELDGTLSLRLAYWERKGEPETFYNAEKEYEDVERRLRALENTG